MAHTKAKGSTKLGRDSVAKRLGFKIFGNQKVKAGEIIVRQRGSKYYSGEGIGIGEDDTLYAKIEGMVITEKKYVKSFTGKKTLKTFVSVKAL